VKELRKRCERCNGSGEIGVRSATLRREVPGPVPEDARGWASFECPDCRGKGEIVTEDEDDYYDE